MLIAFDVGVLFTPEIGKSGERIFTLTEVHIPCAGELEAVGRIVILQVLIESREGVAASEVAVVPRIGSTGKVAVFDEVETTIILYMKRPRRFPKAEFASDLPISRAHSTIGIVHVDKEEGATPAVGLKHFDRGGDFRTSVEFVIHRVTKVVVQLYVLCSKNGGHQEQTKHKKRQSFHSCFVLGGFYK